MIVVVCPGQGSQTPGFLAPWLADPEARSLVERFSEISGVDLIEHGTVSDADTIRDTAVAQPLIVTAGLLALRALRAQVGGDLAVGGIAGHSVGELTAAVGAGILTEDQAIRLVTERATAMAAAAAAVATGMSAVLGGDPDAVIEHVRSFDLEPANYNGGGQIVVAGRIEDLARLADEPLRGTRVVPLQVAGAFHTHFMAPAREHLATVAATVQPSDPTATIWTNNDGSVVADGQGYLDRIVTQVASPVRWDRCMEGFAAAGATGIVELAPAGALVGLAKRALRGTPSVAISTPADLAEAAQLISSGI